MGVPADWYLDPTSRNERRYWDGARWTEHVVDADGNGSLDPLKNGREHADLLTWGRDHAASDDPFAPAPDRASARVATASKAEGPPDERHKIVIALSMLTGTLWLALVALAVGFIPMFGPIALIFGLVAVWFSLIARLLVRGASDLEVVGPMRNAYIGILAASIGALSTALLVAMLRGGDVAMFVVCLGQTTETSQCWAELVRAAVERIRS